MPLRRRQLSRDLELREPATGVQLPAEEIAHAKALRQDYGYCIWEKARRPSRESRGERSRRPSQGGSRGEAGPVGRRRTLASPGATWSYCKQGSHKPGLGFRGRCVLEGPGNRKEGPLRSCPAPRR